jgi:hypothetical protein
VDRHFDLLRHRDVPEFIDQFEYIVVSNPNWDWRTFNLAAPAASTRSQLLQDAVGTN